MEKRKYLGSANPHYIKTYKSEIVRVDDVDVKGYSALVRVEEVHTPYMVGDFCLYDNGYSEICFLPDNEN